MLDKVSSSYWTQTCNLKNRTIFITASLWFVFIVFGQPAASQNITAHWNFDVAESNSPVFEEISGNPNPIQGYFKFIQGVSGFCLKLDGYTTKVIHEKFQLSSDGQDFSIEAWVALQSLPWNWSAIVNQGLDINESGRLSAQTKHNFFFGVNAFGQLGFHLNIGDVMIECLSSKKLSLLKWNHVVATYNGKDLMRIYVNGELEGEKKLGGSFNANLIADLWLGMNFEKLGPVGSERKASENILSGMVIHGLLDEIKIYDAHLSAEQIKTVYESEKPEGNQTLNWEKLPSGSDIMDERFNATYTRLNYTEEWESRWRVGSTPDILITFDKLPVRFLFWRGTGYGGVWVSENGIWMGDQSLERAGKGKSPLGCSEHMADKQTRYSHVRILEKNDARILIHWRYAISDIMYNIFGSEYVSEWGEWADEYYYIYPDGMAIRYQVLWTDKLSHEWQETIVINQPGDFPEDNIEMEAMSLFNIEGETKTYSWENTPPSRFDKPENIVLQRVNLKSEFQPFIVFEEGVTIKPFQSAVRPEFSVFPWWNHWPVSQLPNDGRLAFAPDRPSHSSLSQSIEESEVIHNNQDGSYSVVTLTGMTNKPDSFLVALARSWNRPSVLNSVTENVVYKEYNKTERAYILQKNPGKIGAIEFNIAGTETSPIVNPVIIIKDWGSKNIKLKIKSKKKHKRLDYRYGLNPTLNGTDLILWVNIVMQENTRFIIKRRWSYVF